MEYKAIALGIALLLQVFIFSNCGNKVISSRDEATFSVKIVNQSSYTLEDVTVFSKKVGNLGANDSTDFVGIVYNINSTDHVISLRSLDYQFVRYINTDLFKNGANRIFIDSLAHERNMVYLTVK